MSTTTRIGTLRCSMEVIENGAVDEPKFNMYAPAGIVLENDGRWEHWMFPGEEYDVDHDGVGWVVTCRTWTDGHVRRLAAAGEVRGRFVSELPMAEGPDFRLVPGVRYGIHSTPGHTFFLVQH